MATTTLPTFLRDRRERVHPATTVRRRTPGLRREEVAARAGVSVTWYTWLEQGRGGVPSDDVLERLARALELDDANREMLFLLAHDRPPPRKPAPPAAVTPSLQLVLDNLSVPAFVKTPTFQIVAWNRAAVAVLGDYAAVPERDRNLLRPHARGAESSAFAAEHLGLATKIEARQIQTSSRQIQTSSVEVLVSRIARPAPGAGTDLVNIVDVGFGVCSSRWKRWRTRSSSTRSGWRRSAPVMGTSIPPTISSRSQPSSARPGRPSNTASPEGSAARR